MSGIGSGTQSPPLEATGKHIPMGVSAVGGGPVEGVPDAEQRKGERLALRFMLLLTRGF